MNRKLLKKTTSVSSEKIKQFRICSAHRAGSKIWFSFQTMILGCTMWNVSEVDQKCISRENKKNWPAALQWMPIFHGPPLPQRSCQKATRLKLIFLEENCPFFSLRNYSWEVGKERRELNVTGSSRCFAQLLDRPLLPSETHFVSKVLEVFQLRWHGHFLPPERTREPLFQ